MNNNAAADSDDSEQLALPSRPGQLRQDTDLSMLDYYHNSAGRHSQLASVVSLGSGVSATSSMDDLSMGPNGYYHPGRASGHDNSSSDSLARAPPSSSNNNLNNHRNDATAAVSGSHRLSGATVRYGDQRTAHDAVTPTRASFLASSDVSDSAASAASSVQRKPSKRAAANADNRRIAIMELGDSEHASDSGARRARGHSDSEGLSDRHGMSVLFTFSSRSMLIRLSI